MTEASSSLSAVFAQSNGADIATNFFSDSVKSKFARKHKPEEFNITSTVKDGDDADNDADDDGSVKPLDDIRTLRNNEKKRKRYENRSNKFAKTNEGIRAVASTAAASTDAVTTAGADSNDETTTVAIAEHDNSENHKGDDDCTIFVGNVPITESIKTVTKFFKSYGEIVSVRLRSVPISGAKVDEAGNQNLVRKVCVNSKQFGEQKGSFNAYVRFGDATSATEALQANNSLFGSRHVRVDRVHPTLFDPRRSIFLGNLPHYADEEELREYFAKSLANGHDDIEGLRIIRDPNTLVGKGIGYLLLKDRDAVFKALQLDKSVFKKRWALRVSVCGKRTKRDHAREENQTQSKGDSERSATSDDEKAGSSRVTSKAKVVDKSPVVSINASYAMKRIKMKSSSTRNQLLKERNQKNNKKGKRLGGVIKRAMKASRA